MAENKTKPTETSVAQFLAAILDEQRRQDCQTLVDLMSKAAGAEPKLWGGNIIGFGQYHYVYESGREGDSLLTGFSPRKPDLVLYVSLGASADNAALLEKLGKHKTGKGCLYVTHLADVDRGVLEELIRTSIADLRKKHGVA